MKKTVLHIFGTMDRGGAETRTVELMRSLASEGIRFEFVALSGRRGDFDDEIHQLGGTVHYLKLGWSFPLRFFQMLLTRRFDTIHSHVHLFSGWLLLAAHIARIPQRIAHFRSTGDGVAQRFVRKIRNLVLTQLVRYCATDIIGVSAASLDATFGQNWQRNPKYKVIYSGISRSMPNNSREAIRAEFGIPSDAPLIIHVGRQAPEKNHERLLRICSLMEEAHLLLVGRLNSEFPRRNERVHIAGLRSDVQSLLSASDLMIFPSKREGLPGVVVEAMSVGTPVLASSIDGITELQAFFPQLRLLSLAEHDRKWADAANLLLDTPKGKAHFPEVFDNAFASRRFRQLYLEFQQ